MITKTLTHDRSLVLGSRVGISMSVRWFIVVLLLAMMIGAAQADLNGDRAYGHPVYTKQHVDYHMSRYQRLIGSQARTNRILRKQVRREYTLQRRIIPWINLARCESGNRWSLNNGNGFFGGLQFTPGTWRGFGGTVFSQDAHQATPIQQVAIAQKVLASQGRGAWPHCSKIGAW